MLGGRGCLSPLGRSDFRYCFAIASPSSPRLGAAGLVVSSRPRLERAEATITTVQYVDKFDFGRRGSHKLAVSPSSPNVAPAAGDVAPEGNTVRRDFLNRQGPKCSQKRPALYTDKK